MSTPLGDFGGDGRSDIVFRRNDGAVTLWQMNGGTVVSTTGLGVVGTEWSIGGIADLNADGKRTSYGDVRPTGLSRSG